MCIINLIKIILKLIIFFKINIKFFYIIKFNDIDLYHYIDSVLITLPKISDLTQALNFLEIKGKTCRLEALAIEPNLRRY